MARIGLVLALSLAFCLLLAGCGGGSSTNSQVDPEKSRLRPQRTEKIDPPEMEMQKILAEESTGTQVPPDDDE